MNISGPSVLQEKCPFVLCLRFTPHVVIPQSYLCQSQLCMCETQSRQLDTLDKSPGFWVLEDL